MLHFAAQDIKGMLNKGTFRYQRQTYVHNIYFLLSFQLLVQLEMPLPNTC